MRVNKAVNDNLEQQAKSLYEEMFLNNPDANMVSGTLSDIATVTMGQSPNGSSYNEDSVGEVFYQGRAEFGFRFPTRRLFTTEPKRMAEPGDVLLSVRAPVGDLNVAYEKCCIGRGLGAIHSKTGASSFMLYTMFALKPQLDVFNGEGTVFGSINRDGLSNLPVNIPSAEEIAKFEAVVRPMDNLIRTNYEEICRLQSIRDSLLPKLMSGESCSPVCLCALKLFGVCNGLFLSGLQASFESVLHLAETIELCFGRRGCLHCSVASSFQLVFYGFRRLILEQRPAFGFEFAKLSLNDTEFCGKFCDPIA